MTASLASDWVDCPICGEPDMRREPEPDEPGKGYIRCVNLNCGSNGGDNFSGLVTIKIVPSVKS